MPARHRLLFACQRLSCLLRAVARLWLPGAEPSAQPGLCSKRCGTWVQACAGSQAERYDLTRSAAHPPRACPGVVAKILSAILISINCLFRTRHLLLNCQTNCVGMLSSRLNFEDILHNDLFKTVRCKKGLAIFADGQNHFCRDPCACPTPAPIGSDRGA